MSGATVAERLRTLLSTVRLTLANASARGVSELTQDNVQEMFDSVCEVMELLDIEPPEVVSDRE